MFSQNFPLAIERGSAHAGSTIEDCILSYKSDFIHHNSTIMTIMVLILLAVKLVIPD